MNDDVKVLKAVEILDKHFHASPTKLVRFDGGKVIAMNRKERRANHLYGKNVKRGTSGG